MKNAMINPYFALVIGVVTVSCSAILVRLALALSGVIAFYRLLFTVLLLLPVFLIKCSHEMKLMHRKDLLPLHTLLSSIHSVQLPYSYMFY